MLCCCRACRPSRGRCCVIGRISACWPSGGPDLILTALVSESLPSSYCQPFSSTGLSLLSLCCASLLFLLTSLPCFQPPLPSFLSFVIHLPGPLTVSIEDPPPAPPPPLAGPSFPPSSTSVFSPPSQDRWNPDRARSRGLAPNRNARIPPRTDLPLDTQPPFVWRRGGLTECTASCGKG